MHVEQNMNVYYTPYHKTTVTDVPDNDSFIIPLPPIITTEIELKEKMKQKKKEEAEQKKEKKLEFLTSALEISFNTNYFFGSILFIAGSAWGMSKAFHLPTSIMFIIGSANFWFGATSMFLRDIIQIAVFHEKSLLQKLNMTASTLFFLGGVLFIIGSALFTPKSLGLEVAGEQCWNVGSGMLHVFT